ncbi:MAG: mechanosensitive ion channel family protein [Planctomycetales bacterium]|nr:mechanosensitive ion channel family protein [Planctomycetales bacterium]
MKWDDIQSFLAANFRLPFAISEETLTRLAMSAIGALLLLFVAWILAGWASRFVHAALTRAKVDMTLTKFLSRFTRWLILLLAGLGCLGAFGIETTSFAAVIGAVSLAIGLAFQGSLSNFAAGVMLLVFRPFKVGDVVNVAGNLGKIDEIELFTTALDTFDNRRFIIPNSAIFGATIENISFHPRRRVEVPVGVCYSADIDATRAVLEQAAASVPLGLGDPAPAVLLMGLGASSVDWMVHVWANSADFGAVKQATIRAVKMALDEAGISIPFPQMDVHLDSTPPVDRAKAAPPEAPCDDGGPEADSPEAGPSESPNPDATAAPDADDTAKPGGEVRVGRGLFHSQLFRSE